MLRQEGDVVGTEPPPPPPSSPPSVGEPPSPAPPSSGAQPAAPRRLGEIAALVSAGTAVVGLLLGFFGLPAVVDSPTARTVTVTETVTARATATATVTAGTTVTAPAPAAPTPTSGPTTPGRVSLVDDLLPVTTQNNPYTRGPLKVNGRTHPTVLSSSCAESTWQLDRQYTTFTVTYGAADTTASGSVVPMFIEVDGVRKVERSMPVGTTQSVTLDVRGVFRITLGSKVCYAYSLDDIGAWIDPVVTREP